jgi:hypothetical protein
MSLQTPKKIRTLQKKLYHKVKAEEAQGASTRHPSVFVGEGFRRAWGVLTETDEVSQPPWALR